MQKVIVNHNERLKHKAERMKELVRNYPCSGQIAKQYCAVNKIKEKTFYYWLWKYRTSEIPVLTRPTILPVNIDPISMEAENQPLFAELLGIKIYQPVPAEYLLTLINL